MPSSAVRLERDAQAADVHVDRALLDVDVVAPHLIEQLRARVHALGPRHEELEQAKLRGSQLDVARRAPSRDASAGSSCNGPTVSISCAASGARRRSTDLMRAFSSRGENGLVT